MRIAKQNERSRYTPRSWICLLFTAALLTLCGGTALAKNVKDKKWLLPVATDEESMEKRVASYIKKFHEISADFEFGEEDDLFLKYTFESENDEFPQIPVYIDSEPSNSIEVDGETVTTERRIVIKAFYVLPDEAKTEEARRVLLDLFNTWHLTKWVPQRLFLDADGDIAMESAINVPGEDFAVHAEIVIDQLYRMHGAWGEFFKELTSVDGLGSIAPMIVPTSTVAFEANR